MTSTRFRDSVLWFLLITFGGAMTIGFACQLACGQDVSAARSRLEQIERDRKQAEELAAAKAADALKAQAAAVDAEIGDAAETPESATPPRGETPAPQPDPAFETTPDITFSEPMKAAAGKPYFERYTASYCQPCKQMESEGFDLAVANAGYELRVIDVTDKPVKDVENVPQIWLRAADDTPVRRWIGYRKAADILKPIAVDGLCKLSAKASKGEGHKRWSGAAFADGLILTCAHHEETSGFFAEFPTQFGGNDFVQIRCTLVKMDAAADLCLLRYDPLDMITVKQYAICDLPPEAVEIPGYFEGDKPKRVQIKRKDLRNTVRGIAVDSYTGKGINTPQVGMSGSPLLTPDEKIAGVQVLGLRNEIDAVSLATIRSFLADVDLDPETPVFATITNGTATPDTIAAAVSAHLMRESGQPSPGEPMGSLFSFDVDAPDAWTAIAAKVLQAQTLEFPRAGLTVDWSGPSRSFVVRSDGMQINPPVKVTVNKWLISYTARLDGINYTPDLSAVTVLLTGAPDLTINLK